MVKRIEIKVLVSLMLTYKQMMHQLVGELILPLQQGLKTKVGKLCLYSFKCINYKGDYQVDSNLSFLVLLFQQEMAL